jgi:RNA polymerase sigma factor (sigma-70 family)
MARGRSDVPLATPIALWNEHAGHAVSGESHDSMVAESDSIAVKPANRKNCPIGVTRKRSERHRRSVLAVSDAEIYEKYAEELVRLATVLVGPDAAADVVSVSVISAFGARAWPDVRHPRAYLYRAVLNESRMTARRDARRRRYEQRAAARDLADASPTPRPDVFAAVAALSPRQRAVVYLTYWEDLDPGSAAALIGISDGAVRRHLARARKTLRKVLDA